MVGNDGGQLQWATVVVNYGGKLWCATIVGNFGVQVWWSTIGDSGHYGGQLWWANVVGELTLWFAPGTWSPPHPGIPSPAQCCTPLINHNALGTMHLANLCSFKI